MFDRAWLEWVMRPLAVWLLLWVEMLVARRMHSRRMNWRTGEQFLKAIDNSLKRLM